MDENFGEWIENSCRPNAGIRFMLEVAPNKVHKSCNILFVNSKIKKEIYEAYENH